MSRDQIGRVAELRVYPVKSLGVVRVKTAAVEPRGLRLDRRWMVVDADGVFMSQRSQPRMSLLTTALSDKGLVLKSRAGDRLDVPAGAEGDTVEARVWQSVVSAKRVSVAADEWLSEVLGQPCSLVAMDDESERSLHPDYGLAGDLVSFADAFPILLTNADSLADLNRRLPAPIGIERFRPNIVVEGFDAWAEDHWNRIQIGDVPFRIAKACGRCLVTTIDPATGERGIEPLRTLATFRQVDQAVLFGIYLIPDGVGTIRVGDVAVAN